MSMNEVSMHRRNWSVPILSVVFGLVMFAGAAVNGEIGLGLGMLAIMVAYAAILVFGSPRSESVALMADEANDERRAQIQQRAVAFTANVLAVVIVVGFMVQLFRGEDAGPWTLLAFIGGASFVGSLIFFSRRG